MNKARLIKQKEVAEFEQARKARRMSKPTLKKTVDTVKGWIEGQRSKEDPRKAFADLFAQPQTQ